MNKNFASIIKKSSVSNIQCVKTPCCAEKSENGKEYFITEDKELQIVFDKKNYGNSTEIYTEIKNISPDSFSCSQVGSAFVRIENNGKLPWYNENKYRIHFCRSCWLGEGQWQTSSLRDLGLYQTFCDHGSRTYASFSSIGSQTTARFYPMIMIEDLECKKTHYFEILPLGNWYIEINQGYDDSGKEVLYVFLSGECEKNDGWNKTLNPGDIYRTVSSVYGTVDGGFEEAAAELIKYKRNTSKVKYKDNIPYVCFNDYMNCCWGMPDTQKAKALIDAAADAGAEVFCMDDGWHVSDSDDDCKCIGDWKIAKKIFEPESLEDIVKYANSKGLIFGAWLEIEGVHKTSCGFEKYEDGILTKRGDKIGNGHAYFYDFRCSAIRNKIESVFDMLYSIGVRYIKNDYNQTVGIGCDGDDSLGEGLRKSAEAFYDFIDKIQNKYPDMIIENCGSGAMRSDSETLSHFHLQSISDQEVYTCNPSVISGTMACMPPEKMGIWSYPYPIRYKDRNSYDIINEYADDFSDGKQTVFNMVGSMLGTVYLSGRIDAADEFNKKLIKDAISVYKDIRSDISESYPIYPSGTFRIGDSGIFCFGNFVPGKKTAYIAGFAINTDMTSEEFDLLPYGKIKSAECIYPVSDNYKVSNNENILKVKLPEGNTAMLVKVDFK